MGPTQSRLAVGDLIFDARLCGPEGGPVVVLLHGWPEFSSWWRDSLEALGGAGYRAVAFDLVVPVEYQIRTYLWCSPPRIGRRRICPARSTVRENGASFSKESAGGGGGIRRTRQRGRGIPAGSNRSAVRHTRFAKETVETSADRECPLSELVG
jgi:hypothetical protein